MKKDFFKTEINIPVFLLLVLAVYINFLFAYITNNFDLLISLDSMGTAISAALCGPIIGSIVGILSALINGRNIEPFFYTRLGMQLVVAFTISYFVYIKAFQKVSTALFSVLALCFICGFVNSVINMIMYNGHSYNAMADIFYNVYKNIGIPKFISSLISQVTIEFTDKVVVVFFTIIIYKLMPEDFKKNFRTS